MAGRVKMLVDAGSAGDRAVGPSAMRAPRLYDHSLATTLAGMGVPAFACTPDQFPELIAAAIQRQDVAAWAGSRGIGAAAR